MASPVVHFEMPAKDKKRAANFYSSVFGWKMTQTGPDMGNYLMAYTAKTDEKGMIQQSGAINGGFFEYKNEVGFNVPHLVLSVDNLDKSIETVKKEGGEIFGDKMDIPGVGKYASFKDTEGNLVGMLQPLPRES